MNGMAKQTMGLFFPMAFIIMRSILIPGHQKRDGFTLTKKDDLNRFKGFLEETSQQRQRFHLAINCRENSVST
jgi:hypothetical protein